MYELKQGSARLVNALWNRAQDPEAIRKLAEVLYYVPEQLQEDIKALSDFYDQAEQEAAHEG